jgi:hypothetical protein
LTVAIISPSTTGLKAASVAKGDGFVDAVDAVDRGAVDHQHAGFRREQIGAAGEGALDMHALAGDRLRDAGGRDVLGDVALSSRTTTISLTPARFSASTSAGPIVVPFFSTSDPWRSV